MAKSTPESVTITMFILYMSQKSIFPCHLFIGDDPQPLSAEESVKLKNDFIKEFGEK